MTVRLITLDSYSFFLGSLSVRAGATSFFRRIVARSDDLNADDDEDDAATSVTNGENGGDNDSTDGNGFAKKGIQFMITQKMRRTLVEELKYLPEEVNQYQCHFCVQHLTITFLFNRLMTWSHRFVLVLFVSLFFTNCLHGLVPHRLRES